MPSAPVSIRQYIAQTIAVLQVVNGHLLVSASALRTVPSTLFITCQLINRHPSNCAHSSKRNMCLYFRMRGMCISMVEGSFPSMGTIAIFRWEVVRFQFTSTFYLIYNTARHIRRDTSAQSGDFTWSHARFIRTRPTSQMPPRHAHEGFRRHRTLA